MSLIDDARGLAKGALALREKVLLVALAVMTVIALTGWGLAIYRGWRLDSADARKETAQVREAEAIQGARDAAQYGSEMIELQRECELEMVRVAAENHAAVERAREQGIRIGREQEAYEQSLARPTDPSCNTFAEAKVCDEWLNY